MNKRSSFIPFVMGIVLGVLAALYLPGYVRPSLPDWVLGKEAVVTGTVTAKQRKDRTLLLAVNTQQGAVLVTITKKADEVDLLVGEGNTIDFTLKTYSPFVDDPSITRVSQTAPQAPATAVSAPADAGPPTGSKGSREAKPQRQTTSGLAGTASKTTTSAKLPAAK